MLVGVARQILNTLEADSLNEVCCAVIMSVLATLRKMSSTKNYNFTQNGNKLIINAKTIYVFFLLFNIKVLCPKQCVY